MFAVLRLSTGNSLSAALGGWHFSVYLEGMQSLLSCKMGREGGCRVEGERSIALCWDGSGGRSGTGNVKILSTLPSSPVSPGLLDCLMLVAPSVNQMIWEEQGTKLFA